MKKLYLFPGEAFVSKTPYVVDTVLGSCVSVAIYDTVLGFGGINHFMLPEWNGDGLPGNKYGETAISHLIQKMLNMGSNRGNLIAKVFGGSELNDSNGIFQIGTRNTSIAFDILKREKIPVLSRSVGGNLSRKVIFYSDTGDVLIRMIKPVKLTQASFSKPKT